MADIAGLPGRLPPDWLVDFTGLRNLPSHPARELDKALQMAGIPKRTSAGKVTFHALRHSFVTWGFECGGNVKEMQVLADHSTAAVTLNIYAHARDQRLEEIMEAMARRLLHPEDEAQRVPSGYGLAVGAETQSATPCDPKELRSVEAGSGGGNRTSRAGFQT